MANQNAQNQNQQWKQQQRPDQQTQKPTDRTGQNAQTGQRSKSEFHDDKSFGSADTNSDFERKAKNRNPSTVAGEEEDVDFENKNISEEEDDESFDRSSDDRSSDRNQGH